MYKDPIVMKVRKAGAQLAKKSNYDLHTFFSNLRMNELQRLSKAKIHKAA